MVNSDQAGLEKLNEASQYRETCEKRAQKIKRLRNVVAILFFISVGTIISLNLLSEPTISGSVPVLRFLESMPVTEYVAFVLALVSLVFLVISVMKSIAFELQAHKAREAEGQMAQRLFRIVLHSKKKF